MKCFGTSVYTALMLVLFLSCSQVQAAEYQARVVGMQFADPPYPGDFRRSVAGHQEPGGKVIIFVSSAKKKIISFDKDATQDSLKTIQFDKQGKKSTAQNKSVKVGFFPKIAEDNQSALIEFEYKFLPRKEQFSKVVSTAGIKLTTANAQVSAEQKKLSLVSGSELKLGPVLMKVKKTGKPQWGEEPLEITFDTDEKLEQLAEIKFFNRKGNEIKSSRSSTMTMRMGDKKMVQVSYKLTEKVDQVAVKAKYWKGLEKVDVPVTINVEPMF